MNCNKISWEENAYTIHLPVLWALQAQIEVVSLRTIISTPHKDNSTLVPALLTLEQTHKHVIVNHDRYWLRNWQGRSNSVTAGIVQNKAHFWPSNHNYYARTKLSCTLPFIVCTQIENTEKNSIIIWILTAIKQAKFKTFAIRTKKIIFVVKQIVRLNWTKI